MSSGGVGTKSLSRPVNTGKGRNAKNQTNCSHCLYTLLAAVGNNILFIQYLNFIQFL